MVHSLISRVCSRVVLGLGVIESFGGIRVGRNRVAVEDLLTQ
jgi:hypothetical protein